MKHALTYLLLALLALPALLRVGGVLGVVGQYVRCSLGG